MKIYNKSYKNLVFWFWDSAWYVENKFVVTWIASSTFNTIILQYAPTVSCHKELWPMKWVFGTQKYTSYNPPCMYCVHNSRKSLHMIVDNIVRLWHFIIRVALNAHRNPFKQLLVHFELGTHTILIHMWNFSFLLWCICRQISAPSPK